MLDFGDQMATQDIKRSPKLHHDSTQQIQKTVAIQQLFALFNTEENGKNAIGKDEVASSNLASSSKKALETQRFWGFCFFADLLTAEKTTTKTTT